jgi:hypothetical protein
MTIRPRSSRPLSEPRIPRRGGAASSSGVGEDVLTGMVRPDVLVEVAPLLGLVGAVGTLELGLLAALVAGVAEERRPMLVALAALVAVVRVLGHPDGGEVLGDGEAAEARGRAVHHQHRQRTCEDRRRSCCVRWTLEARLPPGLPQAFMA